MQVGEATEFHIPHLKERDDVELVSVCKLEEDQLKFVKEKFGFKFASTDFIEALDFEKLDGVVIASPHFAHYENTKAALERGYHVAVEKPMTTNTKDAQAIHDLVNEKKLNYLLHMDLTGIHLWPKLKNTLLVVS